VQAVNPFAQEIVEQLAAASGLAPETVAGLLAVPPNEELGDYAFPCFTLAKERRQNPAALARELAAHIPSSDRIQQAQAAGPYVNITVVRPRFVAHVLGQVLAQGDRFGSLDQGRGKTLVIDFSSPNLAKPFSIAHLRSTAIGHSIYRIHAFLGWRCIGINHLGDWGTNWGQLLAAFRMWGDHRQVEAEPLTELLALYTRFNEELESRPELQDEARAQLERLEAGDPETRALWEFFVREGFQEAERIYGVLGVRFDVALGESHFADRIEPVIERFRARNLARESEGALVVLLDEWDMAPLMLRTSKGTSTYHSRDLAALFHRWEQYRFDKMVYVTDVRQALHFQQLFKALELLGLEWFDRCRHAPFGMLSFKGEKMATRRGNLVFLEDVLDQAVERTARIIEEKNPDLAAKGEVARQVGISAVVFADLDSRRTRNVVFDWDEVLNFDGQTGPYLQYTYARFCSILRKHGQPVDAGADLSRLGQPAEMRVARQLDLFAAQLQQAAAEEEPSYLATYLLDLATLANRFYNELPVLGNDDPALTAARVALVDGVRTVLRTGLSLLGMQSPEEM
jgi:arginyl-tRNA synthetase